MNFGSSALKKTLSISLSLSFSLSLFPSLAPPFLLVQITLSILLLPSIVKPMSNFMSYHWSDSAKVNELWKFRVEENSLKNSGRELNVVPVQAVERVDDTHLEAK